MRYKKGDKVTITMKHLGENQRTPNDLWINQDMIDMEGEVHVIKSAYPGTGYDRYYLEGDTWVWDEWCFAETTTAIDFSGVEELII